MRKLFNCLLLTIVLFLPTAVHAEEEAAASAFHEPQTQAEKMLEGILVLDMEAGGILLKPAGDSSSPGNIMPPNLFTKRFLAQETERGGRLKEEEKGVEKYYSFLGTILSCGKQQDKDSKWLFKTVDEKRREATIATSLETAEGEVAGPVYTLARDKDGWKVDGVDCAGNP